MTLAACRADVRTLIDDQYILDADLDKLIRRAELKMERELVKDGEYKPQQMIASYTGTTDATGLVLPDDYQRMRTVWMNGNTLRWASPDKIPPGSVPEDTEATLYYYKRLTPLAESTSNWLYDLAEDVYVYATALQWAPYGRDDQRLTMWSAYYDDALNLLREGTKSQPTGSLLKQKGRPYKGFYTIENGYVRLDA